MPDAAPGTPTPNALATAQGTTRGADGTFANSMTDAALDNVIDGLMDDHGMGDQPAGSKTGGTDKGAGEDDSPSPEAKATKKQAKNKGDDTPPIDTIALRKRLAAAGQNPELIERLIENSPDIAEALAADAEARQLKAGRPGVGADEQDDEHDEDDAPETKAGGKIPARRGKDREEAITALFEDPEIQREFAAVEDSLTEEGATGLKRTLGRVLDKIERTHRSEVNKLRNDVKALAKAAQSVLLDTARRDLSKEWPSLADDAKFASVQAHIEALQESSVYAKMPVRHLMHIAARVALGDESAQIKQQQRESRERAIRNGSGALRSDTQTVPITPPAKGSMSEQLDRVYDALERSDGDEREAARLLARS